MTVHITNNKIINLVKLLFNFKWGGVQAYHFGKNEFELGVGGEGQDTSQHFKGSPCKASEQKQGQKPKYELKEIELSYCHHSICLLKKAYRKKNQIG